MRDGLFWRHQQTELEIIDRFSQHPLSRPFESPITEHISLLYIAIFDVGNQGHLVMGVPSSVEGVPF